MQYLYGQDDLHTFMNTETYDQVAVEARVIARELPYLKEGAIVQLLLFGDEPLALELPAAVELTITDIRPRHPGRHGDRRHQARHHGDGPRRAGAALHQPRRPREGLDGERPLPRAHPERLSQAGGPAR